MPKPARKSASPTPTPSKPRARSDVSAKAGGWLLRGWHSAEAVALKADIAAAAAADHHYYVYTLSDDQGLFYVGKGTGQRVFNHERTTATDKNEFKAARIAAAGQSLRRDILAFFQDEGFAYGFESEVIAEHRSQLTNLGPGVTDPKERAKARAREMLGRLVPFDQSMARHSKLRLPALGANSAREVYDLLFNELRKEAENPTPTTVTIGRDGCATFGWGA